MTGERKCARCGHRMNLATHSWERPIWGCKLPTGNEVCKFNKERVKNFFTPIRK